MYSMQVCLYCMQVECLLKLCGVEQIEKVLIDCDLVCCEEMMMCMGCCMVLQIYIGDMYVGGYDDLLKFDWEGGFVLFL